MAKKTNTQRDRYIWETIQTLLETGLSPNEVYNRLSVMTGLSVRTIKDIRFNRIVPSEKEKEYAKVI